MSFRSLAPFCLGLLVSVHAAPLSPDDASRALSVSEADTGRLSREARSLVRGVAELTGTHRLEAIRDLGERPSASVTEALASLLTHDDAEIAKASTSALVAQLKHEPGKEARARQLAMTLDQIDTDAQLALLPVLATAADEDIAPPIAALLRSTHKSVRIAAMEALAALRGARACPCALEVLRSATDLNERRIAMQEALRLAALAARDSRQESMRLYRRIVELAQTPEEKQLVGDRATFPRVGDASVKGGRSVQVVHDGLRKDALVYTDRTYTYTEIPGKLIGATYIRTAMEDKKRSDPDYFTVTVSKPVTVYVGFDHRAAKPAIWLGEWTKTGDALRSTDHACRLDLYSKPFPAGTITLGGNAAPGIGAHYVVVITE